MDRTLWLFLHIVGSLGFFAAHGIAAGVVFRLRRVADPKQIQALLDLSAGARLPQYLSLLVLLGAGIQLGFLGEWWDDLWIWASLALLAALFLVALTLIPHFRRLRLAVAIGDQRAINALRGAGLPTIIAVIETIGVLVIVWLMVAKPG